MLHIANGDATADILRRSSVTGEIIPFREALVAGPAPDGVDGEEWIALRAGFLAAEYGADAAGCAADLRGFDATLAALAAHDEAVLWFEHDLFCQVNLLYLLDRIGSHGELPGMLSLVMIDSFPGVEDFRGLGQLSPADLETLFATRAPVTPRQLDLARDAWRAYRSADPSAIERLLNGDTSPLPYLHAALARHLARFPSTSNGLGAVEQRALALIESGATTFHALFREFGAIEPGYGYGDYQLWRDLEPMANAPHPLLTISGIAAGHPLEPNTLSNATLALTGTGRDVLAGRRNAIELNGIDRWLGGAHLVILKSEF